MRSKIEQQVMASVGVVYAARRLTSRMALECYTLLASLVGIAMFASLPHVAQNFSEVASHGVSGIGSFVLSALTHTTIIVQAAAVVGVLALVLLVADFLRSAASPHRLAL